jgi:hypothetical protein
MESQYVSIPRKVAETLLEDLDFVIEEQEEKEFHVDSLYSARKYLSESLKNTPPDPDTSTDEEREEAASSLEKILLRENDNDLGHSHPSQYFFAIETQDSSESHDPDFECDCSHEGQKPWCRCPLSEPEFRVYFCFRPDWIRNKEVFDPRKQYLFNWGDLHNSVMSIGEFDAECGSCYTFFGNPKRAREILMHLGFIENLRLLNFIDQ